MVLRSNILNCACACHASSVVYQPPTVVSEKGWAGLANTPPVYEQDMRPQCGEMAKCNWTFAAHRPRPI